MSVDLNPSMPARYSIIVEDGLTVHTVAKIHGQILYAIARGLNVSLVIDYAGAVDPHGIHLILSARRMAASTGLLFDLDAPALRWTPLLKALGCIDAGLPRQRAFWLHEEPSDGQDRMPSVVRNDLVPIEKRDAS